MLRKYIMTCPMDKYLFPFSMYLFSSTSTELCRFCSTYMYIWYDDVHGGIKLAGDGPPPLLPHGVPGYHGEDCPTSPRPGTNSTPPEAKIHEHTISLRFLGINSSLFRLEFLPGFLPSFLPVYRMLFINRLKFACFADFLSALFKTREVYGFLKIRYSRRNCE